MDEQTQHSIRDAFSNESRTQNLSTSELKKKRQHLGGSEKERLTVGESSRQFCVLIKTCNIPWNQKTVVIMHPDKVPRFVHLSNTSCKGGIGRFVVWVMGVSGSIFRSDVLPKKVME